jgi:predicted MPP superfamily phosphohydrolase
MAIAVTLLCLFIILLIVLFAVSYVLGKNVFMHQDFKNIPFINNAHNVSWLQKQPECETMAFLVVGDIQSGHSNLNKYTFNAIDDTLSFLVQTGDLVSHADEGHYALILHEIRKANLRIPLFVIPGNHDVKENPSLFEKYFTLKQFYCAWNNCLFIFLDTSASARAGYDRQFHFLEQTLLEKHSAARWTFIFMHRPPIDWHQGEPHPDMKHFARFFDILQRYRIDYVFAGHLHDYHTYVMEGTTYIVNGLESDEYGHTDQKYYLTRVQVTPDTVVTDKISISIPRRDYIRGMMTDFFIAHVYYPLIIRHRV